MEVEIITSLIQLSKTQSHDYKCHPGWKIWFLLPEITKKTLVNIFLHFSKDLESVVLDLNMFIFFWICVFLWMFMDLFVCIWFTLLMGAFLHIYWNLFQNSVLLSACMLSLCAYLNMEHGSFWYTILSSTWKIGFFKIQDIGIKWLLTVTEFLIPNHNWWTVETYHRLLPYIFEF